MLIQGGAGSGKTLFGRYLERHLWQQLQTTHFIPVFIALPRASNPYAHLIEQALNGKNNKREEMDGTKREGKNEEIDHNTPYFIPIFNALWNAQKKNYTMFAPILNWCRNGI